MNSEELRRLLSEVASGQQGVDDAVAQLRTLATSLNNRRNSSLFILHSSLLAVLAHVAWLRRAAYRN